MATKTVTPPAAYELADDCGVQPGQTWRSKDDYRTIDVEALLPDGRFEVSYGHGRRTILSFATIIQLYDREVA